MRSNFSLVILLSAAATLRASSVGISVNGTCEAGSCSPSALALGGSETESIDYGLTLPDGDMYLVYGSFIATNSDGSVAGNTKHAFQVTYEGNASGDASQADSLTVTGYYALQTTSASDTVYRDVVGAFGPTISGTSSAASCAGNGSYGCVRALLPPGAFSATSPSFTLNNTAGAEYFDPYFVNNFGAGSAVGSYIVWGQDIPITAPASATPEPAAISLFALGLGTIGAVRRRCARIA